MSDLLTQNPLTQGAPRTFIIYSCSFEKLQAHSWELMTFSKLMNYIFNYSPISKLDHAFQHAINSLMYTIITGMPLLVLVMLAD